MSTTKLQSSGAFALANPNSKAKATAMGMLFIILAVLGFSGLDATAKALVGSYSAPQIAWVRFFGQVVIVCLILGPKMRKVIRTDSPGLQVTRAFCQMGAATCFFFSLNFIGLAEATALEQLSPVLIMLGASLFLGETLGRHRIIGITVAMAGALIILRPGSDVFTLAALLPLATAALFAASALLARHMGPKESSWTPMLWSAIVCTLVMGGAQPFIWQPIAMADLPLFAVAAICGTAAQLCLFRAYALTEASILAPFAYLGLLFATLWGIIVFGEWPDGATLAGMLVIAGSGLYVWHSETRGARRAVEQN